MPELPSSPIGARQRRAAAWKAPALLFWCLLMLGASGGCNPTGMLCLGVIPELIGPRCTCSPPHNPLPPLPGSSRPVQEQRAAGAIVVKSKG